MADGSGYLGALFIVGGLFFLSAVAALYWASKNGQLRDFDKGARVIFDDEEPEGRITDRFPGKSGSV